MRLESTLSGVARYLLPLTTLALAAAPSLSAPTRAEFDHTHAAWSVLLQRHVHGDTFDYGALKREAGSLDAYLDSLQAVSPAQLAAWTEEQRFSFWINAYNAFTVKKVVDNYPLESIRELDRALGLQTIFDREWISLRAHHPDGEDDDLSLNDIEHGILRKQFPDARLHAAINCASASCPPLRGEAFVADRLEAQLEEQMRAFVRDRERNPYDRAKKELRVSEIFKWFEEDFERDAGSVQEYLARFALPADREFLLAGRISYASYDWDLNDSN